MRGSLLSAPRALRLEGAWTLELLSAWEALEAKREAEGLARQGWEAGLCANACLLARALRENGQRPFATGREVLERLTARRIGELAARWARFDREEDPSVLDGEEVAQAVKKAWSTRLMSAFSGVCSRPSALFPRRRGPGR